MPSATLAVSVSEYLGTEYDPNCEYIDGLLVPKPMPTSDHSVVQITLGSVIRFGYPEYLVGAELAVQIRPNKFLVPDLSVQLRSKRQRIPPSAVFTDL